MGVEKEKKEIINGAGQMEFLQIEVIKVGTTHASAISMGEGGKAISL